MGKVVGLIACVLAVFASQANAKIVEVAHFKEVAEYLKPSTLLVLDIDDTLLVPVQTLGNDAWFLHRLALHRSRGMDDHAALEKALAEWEAVRHLTEVRLVEEDTAAVIAGLQAGGVPVMGFTTQGVALATRTVQQLQSLGVDLTKSAPLHDDVYFTNGKHGVLFRHGIVFSSGTPKASAMQQFLAIAGTRPERVVFINDKEANLRDLGAGVEAMGIEFIGLRYGHEDKRVQAFDPKVAEYQWEHSSFGRIVSDEEARQALSSASASLALQSG